MVTHLLESGAHRRGSGAGAIPSIVLHSVLILAAINATAHAALRGPDRPHVVSLPLPLPAPVAPAAPVARHRASNVRSPNRNSVYRAPTLDPVVQPLPVSTFAFDPDRVNAAVIHGRDFGDNVSAGNNLSGTPIKSGTVLSSGQVDRQAELLPGTLAPKYPEAMRASGLEGTVVARFVVDSAGRVEAGSFVAVGSANPLFASAVATALSRARFRPAESGGVRVKQLIEQSFTFVLR